MNKPLLKLQYIGVSLLLLGLSNICNAQNALNIKDKQGNTTLIPIKNIRTITFSANSISINKKDGNTFSLASNNLKPITFSTEILTGINDNQDNRFSFYPNPVNDILTINNLKLNDNITILDVNGNTVLNQTALESVTYVNVNTLLKGVYILRIESLGQVQVFKFIK